MSKNNKHNPMADDAQDLTPEEEAAMVEAAKRAGAQAAQEEIDAAKNEQVDELLARIVELETEAAAAKDQAADASDRLLRLQAEWDNFRRRSARERLAERERAAEKLVLALLPVMDDMERAIDHAEATAGDNEALIQFVQGIDSVHSKMIDALSKEGAEMIDPTGEVFDPLAHQAVGRVDDASVYDETVAQVFQKGCRMGGKVIRPAMVTVAFGGEKRPAEPEPEAEADETETQTQTDEA